MDAKDDSHLQDAILKLYFYCPPPPFIPPNPGDFPHQFIVPKSANPVEYFKSHDGEAIPDSSNPDWLDREILQFGVIAFLPRMGQAYPELCVVSWCRLYVDLLTVITSFLYCRVASEATSTPKTMTVMFKMTMHGDVCRRWQTLRYVLFFQSRDPLTRRVV